MLTVLNFLTLWKFAGEKKDSATKKIEKQKGVKLVLMSYLSFFRKNIPTPIKAGMSKLVMKSNIDALNPTEAVSPICERK